LSARFCAQIRYRERTDAQIRWGGKTGIYGARYGHEPCTLTLQYKQYDEQIDIMRLSACETPNALAGRRYSQKASSPLHRLPPELSRIADKLRGGAAQDIANATVPRHNVVALLSLLSRKSGIAPGLLIKLTPTFNKIYPRTDRPPPQPGSQSAVAHVGAEHGH